MTDSALPIECRPALADLACDLIAAPSANPPGDVRAVMDVAERFLNKNGLDYVDLVPAPGLRNLVAQVDTRRPGPHLVMNAHLDVFPPNRGEVETVAGERREGRIYGRGAVDMKGGAAAFLMAFAQVAHDPGGLRGKLSLCLVCDEETFGPHGSRAVLDRWPDLYGDALLSSEPSAVDVVRLGERGFYWCAVTFRGPAGHSAYDTGRMSSIVQAARFIDDLLREVDAMNESRSTTEAGALGPPDAQRVSVNIGKIQGGVKINMQPAECLLEVDIRLPQSLSVRWAEETVTRLAGNWAGEVTTVNCGEPNVSEATHDFVRTVVDAVTRASGRSPRLEIGRGCTDARLWRTRGIPAVVYGPSPQTMATDDEYIDEDELFLVADTHFRVARSFLAG